MAFSQLQASTTAYAEDVHSNFIYIGQGDMLPMANTATMANTTGIYDLGSDENKWSTIYLKGNTTTTFGQEKLIFETTLSTSANTIEVTGLDGDTAGYYRIMVSARPNTASCRYTIVPNGDTTSTYLTVGVRYNTTSVAVTSIPNTGSGMMLENVNAYTQTTGEFFYEGIMSAKVTNVDAKRDMKGVSLSNLEQGKEKVYMSLMTSEWNDATSTITTLVVYDHIGGQLAVGTYIGVWSSQ